MISWLGLAQVFSSPPSAERREIIAGVIILCSACDAFARVLLDRKIDPALAAESGCLPNQWNGELFDINDDCYCKYANTPRTR